MENARSSHFFKKYGFSDFCNNSETFIVIIDDSTPTLSERRAIVTPYDPYIAYKDLTVDLRAHRVRRAGCELCLTPREFALLAVPVTHCDKA